MFCPQCGKEVENAAKFCDGCGYRMKDEKEEIIFPQGKKPKSGNRAKRILTIALLAIAVVAAALIIGHSLRNQTKTIYVNTRTVRINYRAPEGIPDDVTEYEYDERGNLKKRTSYNTSYTYSSSTGLLDVEHNVFILEYTYNDKGVRDGLIEYTYNKNGDLLTTLFYRNSQDLTSSTKYQYDSKGKLTCVLTETYSGDEPAESIGEPVFDEAGTLTQVVFYDDDHAPEKVYEYDAYGNTVGYSRYYDGELDFRYIYTYEAMEVPAHY